jgi:hypothetical protein
MQKTREKWYLTPLEGISRPFFPFRYGKFHSSPIMKHFAVVFSISLR